MCDGTGSDCTPLGDWEAYSSFECLDSGVCTDTSYTNECDCLQNGSVWTSDGHVWSPTSLWTSYDLPSLCDENNYEWNYANQECEALGGHLVTINSQEEQDFLTDLSSWSYAWIGLVQDTYSEDYIEPIFQQNNAAIFLFSSD